MKILIIMDPGILVPPKGYGGIERMVEVFAREYLRIGHEVHLLVTAGSKVEGCVMHSFGKEGFPPKRSDALVAIPVAWKFLLKHRHYFDLIHNFGRLAYLLPVMAHPVQKIMSYQREISARNIKLINNIKGKNIVFTACSGNLLSRLNARGPWEVVYNAIEFSKYTLQEKVNETAPLIFLGRIEKIKGCHTAIAVAKATGSRLIIAGNISPLEEERKYYENEIKPWIDGVQVIYAGALDDAAKSTLLGTGKALLFPIEWNEPFGIVMIESMACGTPVIAFNRGSVNEVIDEGITGYKVKTRNDMIKAVNKINAISRSGCRYQAEKRFNVTIMAKQYLHISGEQRKNIVIVSTHQPAANPRALKEYETLKACGYRLRYLYAYNADWSHRIDEEKFRTGLLQRQDFIETGGNPHYRPVRYFVSRLLHKLFRAGADFIPFCKAMSTARSAFALRRMCSKYPAQLYIAHYLGALPAALKAARQWKAKLIFDAEDFHRGEQSYYAGQVRNVIAVEDRFLPYTDLLTTASPLITSEYKSCYPHLGIQTVNNVFSVNFLQSLRPGKKILKLFWFSQHVGMYRGLEVFVQALNKLPALPVTLTIMGNIRSSSYHQRLLGLSECPEKIIFQDTVAPEQIFSVAANYDIGLAGEIPNCYNKNICLSNKIFTYLLAGNCILASDMRGQKEFMEHYPGLGFVYKHDDPGDLAGKIQILYGNRALLKKCKENSRLLAQEKMNWENEKQKWLRLVGDLLNEYCSLPYTEEKDILPGDKTPATEYF